MPTPTPGSTGVDGRAAGAGALAAALAGVGEGPASMGVKVGGVVTLRYLQVWIDSIGNRGAACASNVHCLPAQHGTL